MTLWYVFRPLLSSSFSAIKSTFSLLGTTWASLLYICSGSFPLEKRADLALLFVSMKDPDRAVSTPESRDPKEAVPSHKLSHSNQGGSSPKSSMAGVAPAATPAPSFNPPVTFSAVIDDDHNTINRYAGRLKKAKTIQDRIRLLKQVTWRLVRHDVSEDLVMRPAFIAHLGAEGAQMAEHDRQDHERAKSELLGLFGSGVVDGPEFVAKVDALFAELREHMKVESGEQIPTLERMLGPFESRRLGSEYIKTLVLTPDLEMVDLDTGLRKRVWSSIEEYVRTDLAGFRAVWERLTEEQSHSVMSVQRLGNVRGKL